MRLNIQTDYALRMLMYLAIQGDRRWSIGEIATAYGISENHLMKITRRLAATGFVDAARGRGGGLRLGHGAETVRVGDVVRAIEHDINLVECFGADNACPITPACVLRKALDEARRAFLAVRDNYTLSNLVKQPRALRAQLGLEMQGGIRPS
jgi:Rrf2 family nitric oxide-sensitive transcriptional repressor